MSDASLTGGGRASAVTTPEIAKTFFRFAQHKGEHVRLDWAKGALAPDTDMSQVPVEIEDLINCHSWTTTERITFKYHQHINLLETKMIHKELVDSVHNRQEGLRCVLLVDSRAAVGAWTKGRSSSRQLNRLLRRSLGWQLAGRKSLHLVWIRSEANPADHPSRGRPIPEPSDKISDVSREILGHALRHVQKRRSKKFHWNLATKHDILTVPDRVESLDTGADGPNQTSTSARKSFHPAQSLWKFKEVFAGKGVLTHVFKNHNLFKVLEPFEIMHKGRVDPNQDILQDHVFGSLCEEACHPRQIWHFAFPCGSFSLLQNLNKGSRSSQKPEGLGMMDREITGNEILHRTLYLCELLHDHGSFFTLENPQSSYAWKMPAYILLKEKCYLQEVVLDQCRFNLRIPNNEGNLELAKKPTIFSGTLPGIETLGKRCGGNHQHVQVIGGARWKGKWTKRSTLAGAYPAALCSAYHHICDKLFC